jgi:hypothetical protein
MSVIENPALKAFIAQILDELILAQVLIRRNGTGYDLRHLDDTTLPLDSLHPIEIHEARALAQATAAGEFRPLKSAPTLPRGWRITAKSDAELERALSDLYPGAVADWYAAQSAQPPVTHYRNYTNRQSGMYRITTMLTDDAVAQVIQTICAPALCLKRRLWTIIGLAPDAPTGKSLIPCLEPCAVLMESARQAVRVEQKEKAASSGTLAAGDKAG